MVKREYQEIEEEDAGEYSPSAMTSIKTESQLSNETISSAELITTPKKKSNSIQGEIEGPLTPKSKSPAKSRWSPTEDDILIGMMEKVIKDQIWALAKADARLISRTSYGVQYHALMLLRQGTGKGPK